MEQIKKYKVLENYERHIFSEKRQINWDKYSDIELTICDNPVYHWFKSGDSWNNAEFDFDTIEQAEGFVKEQISKVEYIEINEEFDAYYYFIMQYNEDTEEYDIDCDYFGKEYKPKYSITQAKDELYYYIDNLNVKQIIELNNIIYKNQTTHTMRNCVDNLLEYDENKSIDDYDFCIDDFVDFIFWNDGLDYDKEIREILNLYDIKF